MPTQQTYELTLQPILQADAGTGVQAAVPYSGCRGPARCARPRHAAASAGRSLCHHRSPRTCVLELTKDKQTFIFTSVTRKPTPSLLRNFSAPVVLEYGYTDAELAHLMAHDSDAFNRWEAGQRLAMQQPTEYDQRQYKTGEPLALDAAVHRGDARHAQRRRRSIRLSANWC